LAHTGQPLLAAKVISSKSY